MKPEVQAQIKIRDAEESDHSFIFATWLRGLFYGNSFFNMMPKDDFMERYHMVIQNLLMKPSVQITIACLDIDEDSIIGYSLTEELQKMQILHWVHVRPEWRGKGIMKAIVPEETNTITHVVDSMCTAKIDKTAKSDKYLNAYDVRLKNKQWKFKPFLI